MLDDLDAIDWSALTHAYGPAGDVPGLLRTLLSGDSEERGEAIHALFGNIWHQGTVYRATAAAVPFLYELLAEPDHPERPAIACLLACIASGRGYLEVHAADDDGEQNWRSILGEQGQSFEAAMLREATVIASVRNAVSTGLPRLIPFLRDDDPGIRDAVAEALAEYPEHAALAIPALEDALEAEPDADLRQTLLDSLRRLRERRA